VPDINDVIVRLDGIISQGNEKVEVARNHSNKLKTELANLQHTIDSSSHKIHDLKVSKKRFEFSDGKCPTCLGTVDSSNFQHVLDKADAESKECQSAIEEWEAKAKDMCAEKEKYDSMISNIEEKLSMANGKRSENSNKLATIRLEVQKLQKIKEPNVSTDNRLLEERINAIKAQGLEKVKEIKGPSPYAEIIVDAEKEYKSRISIRENHKDEVKKAEDEMEYWNYYKIAFGDNGIRKKIIDGITPALNSRINYWMHILMGNFSLKFDDQLDETIERNPSDGHKFVYSLLSRSQKRRVNLAISQAFAYVMELNTGCSPSMLFLDEVSSSVDAVGIPAIYDMICELAKDKTVFVTTHERDLQEMLDGCEELTLEMKDGVTRTV